MVGSALTGKGGEVGMSELKKVIKGLEKCKRHECDNCTEIGASQAPWDCPAFDDFVDNALSLLKVQESLAKAVEQEHLVNEYLNKQLAERPEIVRCKDCKRHYTNGGACDQVLTDWFCADGKRR